MDVHGGAAPDRCTKRDLRAARPHRRGSMLRVLRAFLIVRARGADDAPSSTSQPDREACACGALLVQGSGVKDRQGSGLEGGRGQNAARTPRPTRRSASSGAPGAPSRRRGQAVDAEQLPGGPCTGSSTHTSPRAGAPARRPSPRRRRGGSARSRPPLRAGKPSQTLNPSKRISRGLTWVL